MDKTLSARTFFSTDCSHTSSRRDTNNTDLFPMPLTCTCSTNTTSQCTFTLTSRKECSRPKLNGKELLTSLYRIILSLQTYPEFTLFRCLKQGKKPDALWKIPTNIQEIQLCKFIVKVWTLVKFPPEVYAICQLNFTN